MRDALKQVAAALMVLVVMAGVAMFYCAALPTTEQINPGFVSGSSAVAGTGEHLDHVAAGKGPSAEDVEAPGRMSKWGVMVSRCEWCGGTNKLEVHHVLPQHLRPDLAHDTNNMVVLCREDHEALGHRHDFQHGYVRNIKQIIKEGQE